MKNGCVSERSPPGTCTEPWTRGGLASAPLKSKRVEGSLVTCSMELRASTWWALETIANEGMARLCSYSR